MTHVDIPADLLPQTYSATSLLATDTGSLTAYDFSLANTSYEARVAAVTKVASVCYGNPKSLGSISLFNRLQAEAAGLPSSSYEFVPILLDMSLTYVDYTGHSPCIRSVSHRFPSCIKYGEYIGKYLLTNLRALIADVGPEDSLLYLNTSPDEIAIIREHFKVFLFEVDLSTRAQMVRHRCSWQELSRRYISGAKSPFQFYISPKMAELGLEPVFTACLQAYNSAISAGIKPEEARRILPQAMMTTIWGAFLPHQLSNFLTLRLDSHAQSEIRLVASAIKDSLHD